MLTLIGVVVVVVLGLCGRPLVATYGLSAMLGALGVYRLCDRCPQAWLAVRSWQFDCLVLFLLSAALLGLGRYAGVIMPLTS